MLAFIMIICLPKANDTQVSIYSFYKLKDGEGLPNYINLYIIDNNNAPGILMQCGKNRDQTSYYRNSVA